MTASDQDLLRQFAGGQSQDAFSALVQRHLNLVYSAAVRQVRSPQLAEEVAQSVFADLARHAARLKPDTILTAWLYQVTRRTAVDVIRRESRRQAREQIATEMNALNAPAEDWTQVEPLLEEAMDRLDETDRAAVLLRYFENKPLHEVGEALGVSDDAAQKRVSRAVERLRKFFAKRGVTIGASSLGLVLSVNAVQAAPAGLAVTISTAAAAALAGTTLGTAATVSAAKVVAITALQKTIIAATVAVLAGAGVYEGRQASRLRDQVETLQQRQAPLAEQVAALKTENERLSNRVAQVRTANALPQMQLSELLKLRGQYTLAQIDALELARLKALLAEQDGKLPDYLTNLMMRAGQVFRTREARAELARMKEKLHFTPDQELSASNILMRRVERGCQMVFDRMTRRRTPEQLAQAASNDNPEAEIKALLTPEQLAVYPEYVRQEKTFAADSSARAVARFMADHLDLTDAQQEAVCRKLSEMNLKDPSPEKLNRQAVIREAVKAGRTAEAVQAVVEMNTSELEEQLKALGDILTPEQANAYREEQMVLVNTMAARMKWELEPPPAK